MEVIFENSNENKPFHPHYSESYREVYTDDPVHRSKSFRRWLKALGTDYERHCKKKLKENEKRSKDRVSRREWTVQG